MADRSDSRDVVRFGSFEWDPARVELRRRGVRLRLTGQPLDVLTILLAHPDRIVTRDELRRELWGEDQVFVDFDQGLNTAIARLRQTLGDSAEHPRFIETIPGRGYRFIAEFASSPSAPEPADGPSRPSRIDRRTWLAGSVGLAAGVAGTYLGIGRVPRRTRAGLPRRFVASDPSATPLLSPFQSVAISPDGQHIAYRADVEGAARLFVRALDRVEGRLLPGTDLSSPFFSPDSAYVGFHAFGARALMRSSVLGGAAMRVADSVDFLAGATWTPDDRIVFATTDSSLGIVQVAARGGRPETLLRPGRGEACSMPEWLPGGRGMLYTVMPADGRRAAPQVAVLELRTGGARTLLSGSHPRYAASGHLVYVVDDDLVAVRFDERRLDVVGDSATVLSGMAAAGGIGQYSVSRDGTLLVAMATGGARRELVWVDRAGNEEAFPAPLRAYTYPRISPLGRRIALNARETSDGRIFIWDRERGTSTPLPSVDAASDLYPVWAADGEHLAYVSGASPRHSLRLAAVGSGRPGDPIAGGFQLRAPYFLSPRGPELVYAWQGPDGPQSEVALWKTSLEADAEPVRLLRGARNADLSPDGRFIVYQSDETGRFEVCVRSFPDIGDQYVTVSTNGGIQPVWSPRGDELFYVEPGSASHLMRAAVDTASSLAVSPPRPLMEWPYYQGELGRTYDVSRPDGERFLAIRSVAEGGGTATAEPRIEIVLDWFDVLEERVPAGR